MMAPVAFTSILLSAVAAMMLFYCLMVSRTHLDGKCNPICWAVRMSCAAPLRASSLAKLAANMQRAGEDPALWFARHVPH